MSLYEKFGEFDSYEELNKTAEGLKAEGDKASLLALAQENGIDYEAEDIEDYLSGAFEYFSNPTSAALGKVKVEAADLKPQGIMSDWIGYINLLIGDDTDGKFCEAVRKKSKSLRGCVAALLKYSFSHQWTVPADITKAAGVSANRVTLGEPDMFKAKEIIREYYLGGAA